MEDDYIRLSKWDLERIVGSMGGVSAYDRQYYKYDTSSLTTGCFLLDPDRSPNTINLHGVPPK